MSLVTPFHSKYLEANARMIDVLGWRLAGTVSTIEEEYRMVRERAGFCDYAFQSSFAVTGKDAFRFLQALAVNDIGKIKPGQAIYTSILDEAGVLIDDTIMFWMDEEFFIVNGGIGKKQAERLLRKHVAKYSAYVTETAMTFLSLQGPRSRDVLRQAIDIDDLEHMSLKRSELNGIPALIARTGFSGELGYEIHIYPEYAHDLWDTLMDLGRDHGVAPYGFDLAFPISLEKGYLFGADFFEGGTLLEYGLGWTVAYDKGDFVSKKALVARKQQGIRRKLVGFEVPEPGPAPKAGSDVHKSGRVVGKVTIGGYSPALGKTLGRAWVDIAHAAAGTELDLEQDGQATRIVVTRSYRFYDPKNKRMKA